MFGHGPSQESHVPVYFEIHYTRIASLEGGKEVSMSPKFTRQTANNTVQQTNNHEVEVRSAYQLIMKDCERAL